MSSHPAKVIVELIEFQNFIERERAKDKGLDSKLLDRVEALHKENRELAYGMVQSLDSMLEKRFDAEFLKDWLTVSLNSVAPEKLVDQRHTISTVFSPRSPAPLGSSPETSQSISSPEDADAAFGRSDDKSPPHLG